MSITCGNRAAHEGVIAYIASGTDVPARRITVHHATVAEVRECFATPGGIWTLEDQGFADEANAEARAEAAAERWWEDGGPHRDAIANEYAMEERMEMQRGVIPFSEAMRQAEGR